MQHLLDTVYNWSINNSLVINTSKCYAMYITGSIRRHAAQPSNSSFLLGNGSVSIVTEMKILRVLFTSDLTWRSQHSLVCKKVNYTSSVVHRLGKSLNVDARKKVIHAFVLPHMRYYLPRMNESCSRGYYPHHSE